MRRSQPEIDLPILKEAMDKIRLGEYSIICQFEVLAEFSCGD